MRVVTWNINNVVRRIDLLLAWLQRTQPDVLALQELKAPTASFPTEALAAVGYRSLVVGQRTWNGVALLARNHDLLLVNKALPGDADDKEARYIEAAVNGVLYACLYLPNGNPQPGPKFEYKLRWFERLRKRAQELWDSGEPVVLLGDWNVVPTDADIYKPDTWRNDALLQPEPRAEFAAVLKQGWTDALESVHPGGKQFTFWDYRRKRWERNAGLRIDHILVSKKLQVRDAGVDREERGKEGASDHAPVWAELQVRTSSRATRARPLASEEPGSSRRPRKAGSPSLPGASKAKLPESLSPQLATLAAGSLPAGDWVFEVKYDGYRILARFDHGRVRLFTRAGHDWTDRMSKLAKELETLELKSGWLDGEIVVMGPQGTPDFNALQKAFDTRSSADIVYFVFDVPFLDGMDLREVELGHRRELLRSLLRSHDGGIVRYSADVEAAPTAVLEAACRLHLEGVIAKRLDSTYSSRRSETWLKLKCKQRQEFVIAGYTDRTNGPGQVGSLLLGVYGEKDELISVGSVGTGWDATEAAALKDRLQKLEAKEVPFAAGASKPGRWSRRVAGSEHWVQPKLVAEVEFAEWTPDGQIRHASFVSLRSDKSAKVIVRERAKVYSGAGSTSSNTSGVKVSHGDRVIDPTTGFTKLDLVRYYESVAEWMLPHLKGRPVSLVRGPSGVRGQLFFQKHDDKLSIPGLKELPADLWPGHPALLEVPTAKALVSSTQMNVIEFHTWNSLTKNIDKPDRMVFDLDPGEGTPWAHVQEAAVLVRALLEELGLDCWLKTSGGKGLHVVVPITPKPPYSTVKALSKTIVEHLAKTIPQRFVAKSGPSNRVGKLFVDYLRNGHGATTATAFSARARPGMGVSMPIAWDDLPSLKSGANWSIATAPQYLASRNADPWSGYWQKKQSLASAMRLLGFEPRLQSQS